MLKLSTSLGPGDYDPPDDNRAEEWSWMEDRRELDGLDTRLTRAADRDNIGAINCPETKAFVEQILKELDAIRDRILKKINEL